MLIFRRKRDEWTGWIAQLVEQWTENPRVTGSIPVPATPLNLIMRLIKGLLLGGGLILVLAYPFLPVPWASDWWTRYTLLSALDNSRSVQVVEHSNPHDPRSFEIPYQQVTYAKVVLSPAQIASLRGAVSNFPEPRGTGVKKCSFVDHHSIEITGQNSNVTTLNICFHCGQLRLDQGNVYEMPAYWRSSLSDFVRSLGLHPNGLFPPEKKN